MNAQETTISENITPLNWFTIGLLNQLAKELELNYLPQFRYSLESAKMLQISTLNTDFVKVDDSYENGHNIMLKLLQKASDTVSLSG